jgi:hypothetical protein
VLDKATCGLFKLRSRELDERQRVLRDLGDRYGFRILAGATTAILAVALNLPVDRLDGWYQPAGGTNQLEWMAIAIALLCPVWMLPTMVVAWMQPDDSARDEVTSRTPATQPRGWRSGDTAGPPLLGCLPRPSQQCRRCTSKACWRVVTGGGGGDAAG